MWTIYPLVNANLFHFMPILSLLKFFSSWKNGFFFFRSMNLELQSHLKSSMLSDFTNEILHITKFSLINHGSLMKSSLEWVTIEFLQTGEFVLFFTTMHNKAKLSQWITKKKSFPSWHVRADIARLTCPLCYFHVCVVRLVLASTVHVNV